jgi:hypothetical protein
VVLHRPLWRVQERAEEHTDTVAHPQTITLIPPGAPLDEFPASDAVSPDSVDLYPYRDPRSCAIWADPGREPDADGYPPL